MIIPPPEILTADDITNKKSLTYVPLSLSLSLFFIPLNLSFLFSRFFLFFFGKELVFQVSTTVILVGGLTAASFLVDVFFPLIFYLLTAPLLVCSAYGLFFQQ